MQPGRGTGARTLSAADREAGSAGVQVHRLLAVHGHVQGQATSGGIEPGHGAVESLASQSVSAGTSDTADDLGERMIPLKSGPERHEPLQILCLGCHSDDIEIGCGGTILRLAEQYPDCVFHWVVFSAIGVARAEARRAAALFAGSAALRGPTAEDFPDGFMPFVGGEVKTVFEELKKTISPDLILTHNRKDAHQDHRLIAELTWNTFRDHLILEYEIPKYDGDLGQPGVFVPLPRTVYQKKVATIMEAFPSQHSKRWFRGGDLSLSDAVAGDGMQCSQWLRRGFLLPQARAVKCRKNMLVFFAEDRSDLYIKQYFAISKVIAVVRSGEPA